MQIRMRFFARFREIFGPEMVVQVKENTSLVELIRSIASTDGRRYTALFDERGEMRGFMILMRNGRRIEQSQAGIVMVEDGDEIAILPPVSGG